MQLPNKFINENLEKYVGCGRPTTADKEMSFENNANIDVTTVLEKSAIATATNLSSIETTIKFQQ